MEHVLMEVWKIIFLSKWVICRFQPLIFQCVYSTFACQIHLRNSLSYPFEQRVNHVWVGLTPLKIEANPDTSFLFNKLTRGSEPSLYSKQELFLGDIKISICMYININTYTYTIHM